MKNKLVKISLGFIATMFLGVFIQSCCTDEFHICSTLDFLIHTDENGDLVQFNKNTDDGIDTSYNHFNFALSATSDKVEKSCGIVVPFISSAHATSCDYQVVDSIPRSNVNLSLDRDITFDNTVVPAGSNLLSHPATQNAISYTADYFYSYNAIIKMDSANLAKLQFDTGYYQVSVSTTTTNGTKGAASRQVLFK